MSEQTPNSSESLSGAEPSMEDILASIRKIISEDEPVAMESPEDVLSPTPVAAVQTEAVQSEDELIKSLMPGRGPTPEPKVAPAPSESVDLDIDALLGEIEGVAPRTESVSDVAQPEAAIPDVSAASSDMDASPVDLQTPAETESFDLSELVDMEPLTAPMDAVAEVATPSIDVEDDILSILETPLSFETTDAETTIAAPASIAGLAAASSPKAEAVDEDSHDEMDALLDQILAGEDETKAETDTFDATPADANVIAPMESGEDLDLVKSLMADLTDEAELGEADDLDALLAIPDVEATTTDMTETEDDILGDILDMTLEDELAAQPEGPSDLAPTVDEVAAAEAENISAEADMASDETPAEMDDIAEAIEYAESADDLPSLADIAAAAEADAVAVETAPTEPVTAPMPVAATVGVTAAAAGLATLGAATLVEAPLATAPESAQHTQIAHLDDAPKETPMPVKAVQTDAILDEVTETAAAGAFAELNQVVEDKAIFNERGPRIGDLVQEALRPMLKEWLDANLKGIVERAVAKEVKRIASGK